jgi:hypothetical protein
MAQGFREGLMAGLKGRTSKPKKKKSSGGLTTAEIRRLRIIAQGGY